jgi:tetratricopeptide (TPR) repeat protein
MTEMYRDRWGVPVLASSHDAVETLDGAIEELAALAGDPAGGAEKAAAEDPGLLLAHIYRAYLHLYATTPGGIKQAHTILAAITGNDGALPEREQAHLRAARAWADGDWELATRCLESALRANPRDLLALKVAQDLYFFLGNRLELRDTAARVLPHWPRDRPGWGYVQGIYAFGLEENGDYRQAERRAAAALDANRRDVWSVHAMAHVYEMEGRHREGEAFLASTAKDWAGSYFAVHNWWHKALYHLELLDLDTALALYDDAVRATRSAEWLDVVDAAALLWRLRLYGVDVTGRAQALAADVSVTDPVYIFNDWHALMAFSLAGDLGRARDVLSANRGLTAETNAMMSERSGLRLLGGFLAFMSGRPQETLDMLGDIRQHANVVGGSHAQRDVIDLTLLAAAAHAGDRRLTEALIAERVARKPSAEASARHLAGVNEVR